MQNTIYQVKLNKKGLSISTNIIYPLLAAIIVFALVNVLVRFKKKEFLGS